MRSAKSWIKGTDVFLLLMTSHGEASGFGLRLPSEVVTQLTPQEVAAVLDREGVKNRIAIVSACYSGTFVPPLANDNTIVLTAADAQSTSFGCVDLFRRRLVPAKHAAR